MSPIMKWLGKFRYRYVGTVRGISKYTDLPGHSEAHCWTLRENGFGWRSAHLNSSYALAGKKHSRAALVGAWLAGGPPPPLFSEPESRPRPVAKLISISGGRDGAA